MALFSKDPETTAKANEPTKPAAPAQPVASVAAAPEKRPCAAVARTSPGVTQPGMPTPSEGTYLDKGSGGSGKRFCEGQLRIDGQVCSTERSGRVVAGKTGAMCFRSSARFTAYDRREEMMLQDHAAVAMLKVFRVRFQAFRNHFGRDPEPDEPLFFDPHKRRPVAPPPSVIRHQVMAAASTARVDGRIVLDIMRMGRYPEVPRQRAAVYPCQRVLKHDKPVR